MIQVVFFVLALQLPVSGAFGAEAEPLVRLEEGIFARIVSPDSNAVANTGVVILEHAVLVFDTHFTPDAGHDLKRAIQALGSKPVRYVVNSHAHADHTHGNQAFPEALVIGSHAAREEILQNDVPSLNRTLETARRQVEQLRRATDQRGPQEQLRLREAYVETVSQLRILAPVLTFEDRLSLRDGDRDIRLLFLGAGHTRGDIVLHLPQAGIVFAGDLFFNAAIPNVQDASLLAWMSTLEELLKLDAKVYVPGHGAVGGKKEVEAFLNYMRDLRALVQPALERGDSLEQTVRETRVPEKYAAYKFQNFFAANVQKMYRELKALELKQERGAEDAGAAPSSSGRGGLER